MESLPVWLFGPEQAGPLSWALDTCAFVGTFFYEIINNNKNDNNNIFYNCVGIKSSMLIFYIITCPLT